jgi:tetratricopeptide (TPR) repeat protein
MAIEPSIHPFPGLRPFEADEQDLFFGREGQSEEILSRLRQHRFVAVVGASGSGKSSLIRAGLLPYLYGGFLSHAGSHWRVAIFHPGGDPIKNLAVALNDPRILGQPAESADAAAQSALLLEVSLRRSGLGLIDAVRLARLLEREQMLIVVDQFEELFRFADAVDRPGRDEDTAAFVKLLLEASQQRELPIYVVLTMRSDYIGDCARCSGLPEAVTNALYLIPRMTREQRRAAIVEPVRVGGGTIAPRLVIRLLNDVGDDPGQLSIMQHALMRTWDYWKEHGGGGRQIDIDDYLAIGVMADALSQHADEAYAGLPDDRYRAIAKHIFQALSEKGPDNREARRPTTVGKLAQVVDVPIADIVRVLDDFRAPGRSFLMPAQSAALNPDSVIDISHESLIRGWRRMRQWVEEEAESARVYRRLADTASLHSQGTAGLLHDTDLEYVLAWRDKERPNANWGQRYHPGFEQAMAFLEQSRLAREAELRQSRAARRRVQLAGSAATAVIAIVAVIASLEWYKANIEADRAKEARTTAIGIANTLVFDLAQDPEAWAVPHISPSPERTTLSGVAPRVTAMPPELRDWLADRAIVHYTHLIELDPSSESYNGRAAAYYAKADFDHSIADCNKAIMLDSKNGAAYLTRGLAYHAKGDPNQAIDDYGRATMAYRGRGLAYYYKDAFDQAISDYEQVITLDSKNSVAYLYRGFAYHAKGDLDRAITDFDQAVMLDQKGWRAYYSRGVAYEVKHNFDRAVADYSQAIALEPKSIYALYNRGKIYFVQGKLDDAIADFDRTIELEPRAAELYRLRGHVYTHESDFDQAVADFNQAIALDPKDAFSYQLRGMIALYAGALSKALADLNMASEVDPKSSYAAIWLDIVNKRSNLPSRLARAVTLIDMTKWPAPVIRLYLGELSPADVLAAADDRDTVCEANLFIGELALQQGKNEEAARLFRLAAGDCPQNFVERYAATAELKALIERESAAVTTR